MYDTHAWTVLLAGGIGSRFWPLSRQRRPKQLLPLLGDTPLVRQTWERIAPFCPPERTLIVTSAPLADAISALFPELPPSHILVEPEGKNTGPAIAWAAKCVHERDPKARLLVLPSDHYIGDLSRFRTQAQAALQAATDAILTIGMVPTHPETGYGYIQQGPALGPDLYAVAAFVEKPELSRALTYLQSGQYLWNSGIFAFNTAQFFDELCAHQPSWGPRFTSGQPVASFWSDLPAISIDYALMEKSTQLATIPGDFGWSDIGSWRALFDERGDAPSFHSGEILELDGQGNVLYADQGLVATVGISNTIVVHTQDATLVCPLDDAQRVREIAPLLAEKGLKDFL